VKVFLGRVLIYGAIPAFLAPDSGFIAFFAPYASLREKFPAELQRHKENKAMLKHLGS
jgi:hypothetical protein